MTFTTLDLDVDVADPWVILWEKDYYYCAVNGNKIWISKSKTLQDIGKKVPFHLGSSDSLQIIRWRCAGWPRQR